MVRGLKDEAAQGGGGSQAVWEDEEGTGEVREGSRSREELVCLAGSGTGPAPGDTLGRRQRPNRKAAWRPFKGFLGPFLFLNTKRGRWLSGNRET